jgi:hypothetical protein
MQLILLFLIAGMLLLTFLGLVGLLYVGLGGTVTLDVL